MWQPTTDGLHQALPQNPRYQPIGTTPALGHVARVARKQLVTAVAGKDDRNVVARQFGNHEGGYRGGIGKRLVEMPGQLVNHIADFWCDKEFVMVRAKLLRRHARVFEFVVAVFVKANREGLDRLA